MAHLYEGNFIGTDLKIGIVIGRFNDFITDKLLAGAKDALIRQGTAKDNIDTAWVPGAFEIPYAAQKMAQTNKYDAIITLGTVIKGSTPHFDYVCQEAARGISQVSLEQNLPVIFGVLTTNTIEQAVERAGTKGGNKGAEAAAAAVEMANLDKNFQRG